MFSFRPSSFKILLGLLSVGLILIFASLLIFSIQVSFVILNYLLILAAILMRDELKSLFFKIGGLVYQVVLTLNLKKTKTNEVLVNMKTINEITNACLNLAKTKTGALIAFEKVKSLDQYKESGVELNSKISKALLISIFNKNSPLHDGAVIVKDNSVQFASCFFPISENTSLNQEWGARHRAAIGITEISDSIVLIVSEEKGTIHSVISGEVSPSLSPDELNNFLSKQLN